MPQLDRRERFHNHSREGLCDPTVKWTLQELYILCLVSVKLNTNSKESRVNSRLSISKYSQAHSKLGTAWAAIARDFLPHRSENAMKNKWCVHGANVLCRHA